MAYTEWGEADCPNVLVCVHGLTRNGRDFDRLAAALSSRYRVICPDVVGRGDSDSLRDPRAYDISQYVADMVTLIARLGVAQVDWLGTSMGGLIGMTLAVQPGGPLIRKLILNDVGPVISGLALGRIGDYVGLDPSWDSFEAAAAYSRRINAAFGELDEASWQALTQHAVAQRADGRWGFRYDPAIAVPFRLAYQAGSTEDISLWPLYEQITCPTLALRGANSDLLLRPIWEEMGLRGPKAVLKEIPAVGHAPMFTDDHQIALVHDFLEAA